ncbi:SH3 domain-containing protein [Mangrovimonas sp. YM274]|uniref:SH3 domain-containing protein n=1 Tax=Mangrovimonas sp. YM274 TaxID=3070660 RepID=UPI0027DE6BC5|nr:SH3 domain-containing protein [Mangrovimonas sp. YM274]WMI70272.1 SH3 domain-containing protein [Mangrovimonas sp. YM274]
MKTNSTKPTVLIALLFLLAFSSCKKDSETKNVAEATADKTEQIDSKILKEKNAAEKAIKREKELKLLDSYKDRQYKNDFVDENGIPISYTVKRLIGEKINLGTTGVIKDIDPKGKWESYELKISIQEITNQLKINGILQDEIKTFQQVYELEHKYNWGSVTNNGRGINETYEPDTEKAEKRVEIFQEIDRYSPTSEESRTKWKQAYSALIKNSGILNMNSYENFLNYKNPSSDISATKNETKALSDNLIFSINVDNLRVRTSPELNSEKIENLAIGSQVEFIEKSNNQTTVEINNKEITEFWYKVKTPSGNIGWIHGCCFDK